MVINLSTLNKLYIIIIPKLLLNVVFYQSKSISTLVVYNTVFKTWLEKCHVKNAAVVFLKNNVNISNSVVNSNYIFSTGYSESEYY